MIANSIFLNSQQICKEAFKIFFCICQRQLRMKFKFKFYRWMSKNTAKAKVESFLSLFITFFLSPMSLICWARLYMRVNPSQNEIWDNTCLFITLDSSSLPFLIFFEQTEKKEEISTECKVPWGRRKVCGCEVDMKLKALYCSSFNIEEWSKKYLIKFRHKSQSIKVIKATTINKKRKQY